MPVDTTVKSFGTRYRFGISDADAPAIAGLAIRSAELRWSSEYTGQANNEEGHAAAVVVSRASKRKIAGSFSGYCLPEFSPELVPTSFHFRSRRFIVTQISDPHLKGAFSEVTVDAESFANV